MKKEQLTEIVRSFSRKINLGNYETLDIFCSQKLEVPLKEAEQASKEAFEFCKKEVMKSVLDERRNQELKDIQPSQETRTAKEKFDIRTDANNSDEDDVNINEIPF